VIAAVQRRREVKSMDVYEAIEEYLSKGRRGALATITKKIGPAPRGEGAKMFIGDDGRFFGTVGGGCVEAEIWAAAKSVTTSQTITSLHYQMDGKVVENEGMICGGNVDIFLEPVHQRYRDVYAGIRNLEKSGKNGAVVTSYSESSFTKSLVGDDGTVLGDPIGEQLREEIKSCMTGKRPFVDEGRVIEPVISSSLLYLFGAGHVSQYVARVASMAEFEIIVVDDRADFANSERFPEARETIVEGFDTVFDHLDFRGNEYVAILTRGHKHDALVLEEVMKRPTRYVGMIGSKRKTRLVFDHLRSKGFTEEALRSVRAPIGLPIEAETPQEIAVSIVAELIDVRRRS
jgi:xanthine dehydrogenase accessory factor